jgi:hypothetical protein
MKEHNRNDLEVYILMPKLQVIRNSCVDRLVQFAAPGFSGTATWLWDPWGFNWERLLSVCRMVCWMQHICCNTCVACSIISINIK